MNRKTEKGLDLTSESLINERRTIALPTIQMVDVLENNTSIMNEALILLPFVFHRR